MFSLPQENQFQSQQGPSAPRLAYLDNLKTLMIVFVVITHAVITYTRPGLWYYEEPTEIGKSSFLSLLAYLFFTQAYFMSLLFLIAGYFVPASLEKKGSKKFILDRIFRLGTPTLIYIFVVHAICLKLTITDIDLIDHYAHGLITFQFLEWTGPLWFTLALLLFTIVYVAIKNWCDALCRFSFDVTTKNVLSLVALITAVTFVTRIFIPYGTVIFNFQLANFSTYIFMFLLGIISYQKNIFDKIDYNMGKKWFLAAFGIGVPLWSFILLSRATGNEAIDRTLLTTFGGMNLISLLFTFWETFFCVAVIISLIGIFKELCNGQNSFLKFLSQNAFGVYVFHPPILIGVALLLQNLTLPAILKAPLVAALTLSVTFVFVRVLRLAPAIRKIFS